MDIIPPSLFWATLSTSAVVLIVYAMGLFGGNQMPVDGKTVLITGGSDGLGLSAATQLSAKGANVVIVARNVQKLENAIKQIQAAARNPSTQRFHYISADVSEHNYAAPIVAEVTKWNNGRSPDIVWCVAGISTPEFFLDMDMKSMRNHMDINYFGTAEMSQAILKEWLHQDAPVEKEAKHLIMTSSVLCMFPVTGYAPYTPTKAAVRFLSDTLHQEVMLYPQNVKTHLVCPGSILTASFDRENISKPEITKQLEASDPQQTPQEVAEKSIRGLESGKYIINVNLLGNIMTWGCLGGSPRNNAFFDTIMVVLLGLIMPIIQFFVNGDVKAYGKKHGHPDTYPKPKAD